MDLETGNSQGQDDADATAEAKLLINYLRLVTAKSPAGRRSAFQDLKTSAAARSPEQVERMEKRRGLAAGAGSKRR